MITKRVLLITAITFLIIANAKNPIKIRILILIGTSIIFLLIHLNTGNVWFPLIFFILFTGGILIIFIILASILPNEKVWKIKTPKTFITWFFLATLIGIQKNTVFKRNFIDLKSILSSGVVFTLITLIILVYFFTSIRLNRAEQYSIRSFQCR